MALSDAERRAIGWGTLGLSLFGLVGSVSLLKTSRPASFQSFDSNSTTHPYAGGVGITKTVNGEVYNMNQRVKVIREMTNRHLTDPDVYAWSRLALKKSGIKGRDQVGEVVALYEQIRKDVQYRNDPVGTDVFVRPGVTLQLGAGDCDDFTILSCVALLGLGYPAKMVVVRTKGSRDYNHIFAAVGLPKANPTKWIAFDASLPDEMATVGYTPQAGVVVAQKLYDL